jgi:D-sedoheptulose 7-phosphate isomerase
MPVISKNIVEDISSSFATTFFQEAGSICQQIDVDKVELLAKNLAELKQRKGRLFILGVGGSAGNASHAVNDFRKLCEIETYAPTDNVSELTARTNDEGWETVFAGWLRTSKISANDAIFILSVGGGNAEKNVSMNLVHSIDLAKSVGAKVFGIVGRSDGYTHQKADVCVLIPQAHNQRVTPHSEAFQAVVWHCLVSHPALQTNKTKW